MKKSQIKLVNLSLQVNKQLFAKGKEILLSNSQEKDEGHTQQCSLGLRRMIVPVLLLGRFQIFC